MNRQFFNLLRIVLNPRITRTPLRVLRELRAQGKQRLPDNVQQELDRGLPQRHALSFMRQWLDGELLSRHNGQWVLNSFLPPFPGKAFDRMFENLLSGRRLSPVSAFLAVTHACPYDCWHCSLKQRKAGELSTQQWLEIIHELHELGASIIGFTGGEPAGRPDLPELVAAAQQGGAETIVFTSGAQFDRKTANALRQAGLWSLCVSLDSPVPDEYDRLRGAKGAYRHALETLNLSRKTGFYTMMSTVATKTVIEKELYRPLYQIAADAGAHEYRLIEPMPCGNLAEASEETLLNTPQTNTLREFHTSTNRKGRLPKVCAFNQIESPEVFGCGGGTQHLFIDPAGEVCPCDFTPLSFGNAADEELSKIWRQMNDAMVNPRRHCFIQRHHALISKHAETGYPLPPELSKQICAEAGSEPFPDYFALVTGRTQ